MYPNLSKPFHMKTLSLENRMAMAPMSRYHSPNGTPTEDMVGYYQRRAQSGIGLIFTESIFIDRTSSYRAPNAPIFYGEAPIAQWRNIVKAVHAVQGKIFIQLLHAGSMRQAGDPYDKNAPSLAPSAIPHPFIQDAKPPQAMQKIDIEAVIGSFVHAAQLAQAIGFDGVEIHGAHGFLIDQFFWNHTNKRMDEYGGNTLAERMRFAYELVKAMRQAVGVTYPLSFRFSQWKLGDYEAQLVHSPQELASFLEPLTDAGVDIFHVSTRHFDKPAFLGSPDSLAHWTKKLSGKTVIAVGSVGFNTDFLDTILKQQPTFPNTHKLDLVDEQIAKGQYDLIAVGRPLLADPYWWTKIQNNRINEIYPFTQDTLKTID